MVGQSRPTPPEVSSVAVSDVDSGRQKAPLVAPNLRVPFILLTRATGVCHGALDLSLARMSWG